MLTSRKLDRKTLKRMHIIYCRHNHKDRESINLCEECLCLLEYSLRQTENCKLKKIGRLCSYCEIHCFEESKREMIRDVMRFSGSRLILTNPLLAFQYLLQKGCQRRIPGEKSSENSPV